MCFKGKLTLRRFQRVQRLNNEVGCLRGTSIFATNTSKEKQFWPIILFFLHQFKIELKHPISISMLA